MGKRRGDVSDSAVLDLFESGYGCKEISKRTGLAASGVHKRLKKLGKDTSVLKTRKKLPGERGYCLLCECPLKKDQLKFCSRSCAAKVTNVNRELKIKSENSTSRHYVRRPVHACENCSELTKNKKFCSRSCAKAPRKISVEELERRAKLHKIKNLTGVRWHQFRAVGQIAPDADREAIRKFYEECPEGYEVDHVIPLSKGGLHHQDNLQYLTPDQNKRKYNKI